jgi:hypothetical protein
MYGKNKFQSLENTFDVQGKMFSSGERYFFSSNGDFFLKNEAI